MTSLQVHQSMCVYRVSVGCYAEATNNPNISVADGSGLFLGHWMLHVADRISLCFLRAACTAGSRPGDPALVCPSHSKGKRDVAEQGPLQAPARQALHFRNTALATTSPWPMGP